ncbi:MAG: hypothetical protein SH848_18060, partial [Saprospiraceae bacterium]|nr:hypothetical protein [Saprospiraceae bacterium]
MPSFLFKARWEAYVLAHKVTYTFWLLPILLIVLVSSIFAQGGYLPKALYIIIGVATAIIGHLLVLLYNDFVNLKKVEKYVKKFRDCDFSNHDIKKYIPSDKMIVKHESFFQIPTDHNEERGYFNIHKMNERMDVDKFLGNKDFKTYIISKPKNFNKKITLPSGLKVFPSLSILGNYIFLREAFNDLTPMSKFRVYHEIAHLSMPPATLLMRDGAGVSSLWLSTIFISFLLEVSIFNLILVLIFLVVLLFTNYHYAKLIRPKYHLYSEIYADKVAYRMLDDSEKSELRATNLAYPVIENDPNLPSTLNELRKNSFNREVNDNDIQPFDNSFLIPSLSIGIYIAVIILAILSSIVIEISYYTL